MTASTLVTGGAGYIGSHTVRALDRAGRRVVVLDCLELGSAAAVIDAPLVVGDIADEALVEQTCRDHDVDTIVHFAAYKNVGESMQQPAKYFHNNVDGTVRLLDAARPRRRAADRVLVVVFGVRNARRSCPSTNRSRSTPSRCTPKPRRSSSGPALVRRRPRAAECQPAVLQRRRRQLRRAIGEDWTHALNLIPVAIQALLTGDQVLQVFGDDYPTPDGTCVRDYIHVDDLAAAHIAAIDYLGGGGASTAVNVGTGVGSSVLEVLHGIERVAGRPVPHEIVGRRAGRPGVDLLRPGPIERTAGLGPEARHRRDPRHRLALAQRPVRRLRPLT